MSNIKKCWKCGKEVDLTSAVDPFIKGKLYQVDGKVKSVVVCRDCL